MAAQSEPGLFHETRSLRDNMGLSTTQGADAGERKNNSLGPGTCTSSSDFSPDPVVSHRRLLRKLDCHILPWIAILYLLSFLDRANIGNARLDGLEKDLGMHGLQFNHALAIFYPFYIIVEVPSNIMLKRTRPSFWFTFLMTAWGTVMTLMGLVKSYHGLLIARAFLGIAEGGLAPGIAFYVSRWYRRDETGLRMAIYISAVTTAGLFGGLLARGITEMRGVGGLSGWAWIFILEGLTTIVVAGVAFFFIPDHPSTARFLTPEEKAEVIQRLEADNAGLSDEFDMRYFWDAVKDWKTYAYMVIIFGGSTTAYSLAMFLPTIIRNMGYTAAKSQLLSAPPYVVACITTLTVGIVADRLKTRGIILVGCHLIAMVGFILLLVSKSPAVQYAAVYIAAAGATANLPLILAWCGNFGGSMKRGVAIAMINSFGNFGGLLASYTYIANYAPRYYAGHSIIIGVEALAAAAALMMHTYFRRENRRRDRMYKAPHLYTKEDIQAESTKGDHATFFRYID